MEVIKVENVSKAYQLGQFNTGTLANDLKRKWALFRGKEDPFMQVSETNDRTVKTSSGLVWSLKDINLTANQGDTIGIIGRNGAGKSTLLKLLSQITSPTSGTIRTRGRIASLLEVGTGFHPELSGRDNIFLNGAILGMNKNEIKSKFDEIVDFSGVERYLETPVKRYSSGMYVRLAFAVAAHLESEILIVDEVLAVGDAEFQKKCLGKMNDISHSQGRTILFVSHNLSSIKALCQKGVLLENGLMISEGGIDDVVEKYITTGNKALEGKIDQDYPRLHYEFKSAFREVTLKDSEGIRADLFYYRDVIQMEIVFSVFEKIQNAVVFIMITSLDSTLIVYQDSITSFLDGIDLDAGDYKINTELHSKLLPGNYSVSLSLGIVEGLTLEWVERVYDFTVEKSARRDKDLDYKWGKSFGYVSNESLMDITKI
jgi:lipopolysaccharide transport system ATP-binding protein